MLQHYYYHWNRLDEPYGKALTFADRDWHSSEIAELWLGLVGLVTGGGKRRLSVAQQRQIRKAIYALDSTLAETRSHFPPPTVLIFKVELNL